MKKLKPMYKVNIHIQYENRSDDKYIITPQDFILSGKCLKLENRDNILDMLCITPITPDLTKVTKIYRHPHLTLSRDKLSILKDKYNIAVTRKPDTAEIHVISDKLLRSLQTCVWYTHQMSIKKFKEIYNKNTDLVFSKESQKMFEDFFKETADDTEIAVKCNMHYSTNPNIIQFKNDVYNIDSSYTSYISPENILIYNSLLANRHKLVTDITMNDICSEDSITIDNKGFEDLKQMLGSSNSDDKTVAMSIMSNCNIAKSKTYLAVLFYTYGEAMRSLTGWNQVAFKTLRKQFDKYRNINGGWPGGNSTKYTRLLRTLIDDDAVTEEIAEYIRLKMFKYVTSTNHINDHNDLFIIKDEDFQLGPEVKAAALKNTGIEVVDSLML